MSDMVSNRPRKHGIPFLQSINDRPLRHRTIYGELHFAADLGNRTEMKR